jgi:HEAT repeat protein
MKPGKRVALWAVVIGIAVVVSLLLALRGKLAEQWYIWKLDSTWQEERWHYAARLEKIGSPAAESWYIDRLEQGEEEERRLAAQALARMSSARAVRYLMEIVRRDRSTWPTRAPFSTTTIPRLGEDAEIPMLRRDFWKAYWPGKALVSLGTPAIPQVLEALRGEDKFVQLAASEILTEIGSEAIPALVEMLQREETRESEQIRALYAIEKMGREPGVEKAVPALCTLLTTAPDAVREHVAFVLGEIGPGAAPAVPALVSLRDSPDSTPELRHMARSALEKIQAAGDGASRR